jgi:ethanolamine utilization cobalamin adenosyltransferase
LGVLLPERVFSPTPLLLFLEIKMLRIKFEKDYGHYRVKDEVRIDDKEAMLLVNGGYASKVEAEPEAKMAEVPENKSQYEKESMLDKAKSKISRRKKPSMKE